MSTPFHILIIGSSGADVVQVEKHLRERWPELGLERAENVQSLQTYLDRQNWDCVLFDLDSSSLDDALVALVLSAKRHLRRPSSSSRTSIVSRIRSRY